MLDGVRLLGFSGVNVTFPYKEAVVPLLDALSPAAAAIGTVNTVVARNGKLTGHNTDSTGFAAAFDAVLGSPGDKPVALIGAGGVGSAIAFALASLARAPSIFSIPIPRGPTRWPRASRPAWRCAFAVMSRPRSTGPAV